MPEVSASNFIIRWIWQIPQAGTVHAGQAVSELRILVGLNTARCSFAERARVLDALMTMAPDFPATILAATAARRLSLEIARGPLSLEAMVGRERARRSRHPGHGSIAIPPVGEPTTMRPDAELIRGTASSLIENLLKLDVDVQGRAAEDRFLAGLEWAISASAALAPAEATWLRVRLGEGIGTMKFMESNGIARERHPFPTRCAQQLLALFRPTERQDGGAPITALAQSSLHLLDEDGFNAVLGELMLASDKFDSDQRMLMIRAVILAVSRCAFMGQRTVRRRLKSLIGEIGKCLPRNRLSLYVDLHACGEKILGPLLIKQLSSKILDSAAELTENRVDAIYENIARFAGGSLKKMPGRKRNRRFKRRHSRARETDA